MERGIFSRWKEEKLTLKISPHDGKRNLLTMERGVTNAKDIKELNETRYYELYFLSMRRS